MREIKFRAFTFGRMKYFTKPEDFKYFFGGADGPERMLTECELMQFTGKFDRNKREIYEGDIIDMSYPGSIHRRYAYISFINGSFCIVENLHFQANYIGLYDTAMLEVVGNIDENAELLKELC